MIASGVGKVVAIPQVGGFHGRGFARPDPASAHLQPETMTTRARGRFASRSKPYIGRSGSDWNRHARVPRSDTQKVRGRTSFPPLGSSNR